MRKVANSWVCSKTRSLAAEYFMIGSTLKFDKAISFISGYSSDTFKLTQKTAGALVFDGRLRIGRQFLNKHLLNNSARLVA